jgi:hypothetical protein
MLSNDFYCKNKDTYPPFKNGLYLEEYFLQNYLNNSIITKRKYIPCLWTNFQIEFDFNSKKNKMNHELSEWVKNNPSSEGYFTIVQYDDGCLLNLPPNTLIFGACSGDIPIPLIYEDNCNKMMYMATVKSFQNKKILCSFVGCNTTHSLRHVICSNFIGDRDFCFQSYNNWTSNIDISNQSSYVNISCNSKFCLAPRGYGRSSFRFFEILKLGSIPIYVWDDKEWLPYKNEIDYSLFSISININDIKSLKTILLSIDETKYNQMLDEYKKVSHLFTLEGMTNWIINEVNR